MGEILRSFEAKGVVSPVVKTLVKLEQGLV